MARTQENRDVAIATPLGDDVLLLTKMSASEQLGRPFRYELELVSEELEIKASDIVGKNVTIRLNLLEGEVRYFNGYVSRLVQTPSTSDEAAYKATVVPWLWFLTRTADCRIFQKKNVPDIIEEVFKDHGFTDFKKNLSATYKETEFCVQYRETDFNFVSRLMEQEGIYYFFEHENGKHTLVLTDSISAHEPFKGYEQIKYRPFMAEEDEEVITEWSTETIIQPGSYALDDFDFENTNKDLLARKAIPREHEQSDFEIFDYSGQYTETSTGEQYAKVRIEELQAQYEVATATADAKGISPGYLFELTECPREDQNRKYLITSANYKIEAGSYESGSKDDKTAYSVTFTAIDEKQAFRSPRTTPKPTVQGPQTAIVVGPSGEEIHTDKYARVKVQFHWDRYGKADENSSCWIRVAQVSAGKKWGAMYLPRTGQEVIVEFLNGDPDRPVITGRLYNKTTMPPYDLPAEKTKSTTKTNSSKGGAGFNEIRFEDKKDKEQIFIHAEKNQDIRVKNDTYEWIGYERHLIIKQDQLESVEGDKHSKVAGDRITEIGGDENLTTGSDRITDVSGGNHLTTGGDQCEDIGGNQNLKAAMNINEEAGQKISIKAGTDINGKAGMNYAMDAGMAVHIKGGMTVVVEAGMQLSLKAGSSFVDIGPAGVSISGPMIMLNSGGAAGSGGGSSPTAPTAPESPDVPKEPKEADTADPGETAEPPKPKPPTPAKFSPQATTIKEAAKDGTPFCEECEKAKKARKGK